MRQSQFVLYHWSPWRGMLIHGILPGATRIPAIRLDSIQHIVKRLPADTKFFLFHIDLTHCGEIPGCRADLVKALEARQIRVLNSAVTDISKRRVQQVCEGAGLHTTKAPAAGDSNELLIVKSDLNCQGASERRFARPWRFLLARDGKDYPVLARGAVPDDWWDDPSLTIERYIANSENRIFRILVFLDRLVVDDAVNPMVIKKMYRSTSRANSLLRLAGDGISVVKKASDFPAGVLKQGLGVARAMKLDYGSIDLVVDDDGKCYVIDVNATPGWAEQPGVHEHLLGAAGAEVQGPGSFERLRRWYSHGR